MGGKLDLYNLGSRGVVLDKSRIHQDDGELLRAQNWQTDAVGERGGLRRRDGFRAINATPLAGPVVGGLGIPLPDRSALQRVLYLPMNGGASTFKTSIDGTTWADTVQPAGCVTEAQIGLEAGGIIVADYPMIWQGFRDQLYYPADDYVVNGPALPSIHAWDGRDDVTIARVPPNPHGGVAGGFGVTSLVPYSPSQMLVAVADRNSAGQGRARVLLLDLRNGGLSQLGPDTDLDSGRIVAGLVRWQGRVWISGINGSGAGPLTTYAIRPGDRTWTLDDTFSTSHGYCTGLAVFRGELYQGSGADVGAHGLIRKRTNSGVWSTVYTSDGTGAGNYVGPLIVTADGARILAFQNSVTGGAAPQLRLIQSPDGAVWTQVYDVTTATNNSHAKSGMPYLDDNGDIYWPIASGGSGFGQGGLLKRTNAGAWSVLLSALTTVRGPLGIIRIVPS